MASSHNTPNMRAGAAIRTSRILKISGNRLVAECAAGTDRCLFVAGEDDENPGGLAGSTAGYAATAAGRPVKLYGPGDEAPVRLAATVTAGQRVRSDGNALGTPITTGDLKGNPYLGFALRGGDAGDVIPVYIAPGEIGVDA